MKNLYKYVFMGILALGLGSCDDDEENITDTVQDTVETGAVLRTINVTDELVLDLDPQQFVVELEEQDEFEGTLLESVNIYVTFTDNSDIAGNSSSFTTDEVFLRNIPASDFSPGPFGLPRVEIIVPLQETLAAIGGNAEGIYVDDTFLFREELILTDGRIFTVDNAGGIITAGFFNSPFQHVQTVTGGLSLLFTEEGANTDGGVNGVNLATGQGGYSSTTQVIEVVEDLWTGGEVFVQYVDNTVEDGDTDFSSAEVSIGTFSRDMFMDVLDDDGNVVPQAIDEDDNILGFQQEGLITFNLSQISAGVSIDDMEVGDEILLRYSLTNAAGRAITSVNEPFTVSLPVTTCELPPLPDGFMTGSYEIEQLSGVGPFDATFGPQYGIQTVEITQDPTNSDVRNFLALLHPEPQGFSFAQNCVITFNCGQFLFESTSAGGTLGCDGVNSIEDGSVASPTVVDIEGSDDVIIATISGLGMNDGACDVAAYDIVLQFTKQ